MNKTLIVLGLSMIIVLASGAASSSSKAASSSSVAATSSSVTSTSSSYVVTNYTCGKGDEVNCIAWNADYCCMYSYLKTDGVMTYEGYACAMNPAKYSPISYSTSVSSVSTSYSVSISMPNYEADSYCANSVMLKLTAGLVSRGLVSIFA